MGGEGVKNYLDLQQVSEWERGLLEVANTLTEGEAYVPDSSPIFDDNPPSFKSVSNAQILDEGEIRAFLKNPAFALPSAGDVLHACDILQAEVPHIYYDYMLL